MFTRLLGSGADSVPERCSGLDLTRGHELRGGDFFPLAELGAQHFDAPALGAHLEALVRNFNHFADLALHRAEGAHQVLARIEDLQLLTGERGPGPGRRVAAADRVVDEVDGVRPVEARFGFAAPAL